MIGEPIAETGGAARDGKRILQLAHNHPRYHPGGTELTALALHRQALALGHDSWFLGTLDESQTKANAGTQMLALSDDQREAALFASGFRRFELAQDDYYGILREFRNYLAWLKPDVVHVHHVLGLGLEGLFALRKMLPTARIVMTLHDFYLICANHGQLFKHESRTRCPGPTLDQCLKCFPERSPNDFAQRALTIRNALSRVDRLVSPSEFLKQKFEQAMPGLGGIEVVENGYIGQPVETGDQTAFRDEDTVVFGYFGNISAVKGLPDLLDAADLLKARGINNFRIHVHGAQLYEDAPLYERMQASRQTLGDRIRFLGQYQPHEMAGLIARTDCLVFPSIWWENAPLVVYEALYNRRQVLAYPHGGAPEILARYGTGILADSSDPASLADAMAKVISDRSLLELRPSRPIPDVADLFEAYGRFYFGP